MDAKIVKKEPLSLPKVMKIVQGIGKKEDRAEFQNRVLDFAKKAAKLKESDTEKLLDELKELEILGLADEYLVQVVNIMPADLSELKAVLASSKATISPDNFKKIQDVIIKYKDKEAK
jgi:DNA-directed RNA polymerase subunit F